MSPRGDVLLAVFRWLESLPGSLVPEPSQLVPARHSRRRTASLDVFINRMKLRVAKNELSSQSDVASCQ